MDVFSGTDGKTAQNGCAEKKLEEISPLEQYVKNLQHALCFAKKSFSSLFGVLGVFFVICLLNHGTTRLSSKYPNLEMIWEKRKNPNGPLKPFFYGKLSIRSTCEHFCTLRTFFVSDFSVSLPQRPK